MQFLQQTIHQPSAAHDEEAQGRTECIKLKIVPKMRWFFANMDFQAKYFAHVYIYMYTFLNNCTCTLTSIWRRSLSFPQMMLISLSLDSLIGIFVFFLCIEKKGRVYTSGLGASLTWESTPSKSSCTPEWGQAWTGRALLGAPVLLPLQTGCQQRTHPPLPARDWTQTRLTTSPIS